MLTDLEARRAKPREKDYKLGDAGGLYLFVTRSGFRSWRMKYRFGGKEKRLTFGPYPEVTLSEAQERRDHARKMLRDGIDPSVDAARRRLGASSDQTETFEAVAKRWHTMHSPRWAPIHSDDVLNSLKRDVFPSIGSLPIKQIDAPLVLAVLRKIERRGALETAKRVRQRISAVFVHSISEGVSVADPASMVTKALVPVVKRGKQPALAQVPELQALLVDAEASGASRVTKVASRLLALSAVRPGVLRGASWREFEGISWDDQSNDGEMPIWRIPPERMKLVLNRKDDASFEHVVPLSRQAVEALRAIRPLTARYPFVFPNTRHSHRSMSENAIGYLYNRVGYHGRHVPHGWRAAFSTIMNERGERAGRGNDRQVIDLMLAHVPANKVEGAYNRAPFMERRREISQEWADLLTEGLGHASDLLVGPRR